MQAPISLLSIFSICLICIVATFISPGGSSSLSTLLRAIKGTTNKTAQTISSSLPRPNILGKYATPANAQHWQEQFNEIKAYLLNISNAPYPDDSYLTTPQLIVKHGYPFENHTIETEDGYLLEYHRIPCGKGRSSCTGSGSRPPVLIQHGLISESTHWLATPEANALPYQMADEGYDVWLGNARGNKYSNRHVNLTTSDPEYWRFSWHEMGIYDIPAAIDYILGETNATRINYVGHSMGTTMFFVMGSEKPEYMDKITYMVGYGPVAYVQNIISPIRGLAPVLGVPGVEDAILAAGQGELFADEMTKYIQETWTPFCTPEFFDKISCAAAVFAIMGFDYNQTNYDYIPVALSTLPSSTSMMCLIHYEQEVLLPPTTPTFRKFDYGAVENLVKYNNSAFPPAYNLTSVDCPKHFFTGPNDWLATPNDVENTRGQIPNTNYTLVDFLKWNHIDFLVGLDATFYCHRPAISLFNAANGLPNSN